MGILDQFKKNKQEKKNPTVQPPEGHTLAEVLQDQKHSELFGKLLAENGNEVLAKKMAEGKLEQADIAILEEQRKIFSEKITQAEKIEESITEESIIGFARTNPDFQKIVNLVGPEKAAKVIQSQLKELSITDEARFKTIVKKIEAHDKLKNGKYKEINDQVEKLLSSKNITSKEYLDVLAIEDVAKKEKALQQLAKKYGGRWFKKLNQDLLTDLKNSEISIEEQVRLLGNKEKTIGTALFATISENEAVRKSMFSELVNEKTPEAPKGGLLEAKKGAFNEADFDVAWEEYKNKKRFSKKSPADQKIIKDAFVSDQQEEYREKNEGHGFWASIFLALTEKLIKSKAKKLK